MSSLKIHEHKYVLLSQINEIILKNKFILINNDQDEDQNESLLQYHILKFEEKKWLWHSPD